MVTLKLVPRMARICNDIVKIITPFESVIDRFQIEARDGSLVQIVRTGKGCIAVFDPVQISK